MPINTPIETAQDPKPLTHWFHVFASMIDKNEIRDMGTTAFAVYCVIKRHAAFHSGESFPSVETIADRCGLSDRQVWREIDTLVEKKYIEKRKMGRRNCYALNEKISITTMSGEPGVATFKYSPSLAQECVREIKSLIASEEKKGKHVQINIEHLTLNVQVINDNSVTINNIDVDSPTPVSKLEIQKSKAILNKRTDFVDN